MGNHHPERDLRTAQQKWVQMMTAANFRGYLFYTTYPPGLEDLLKGWDHSKPCGASHHVRSVEAPGSLRSKGSIPLGIRDDTPVGFTFHVTTFPCISPDDSDPQSKTRTMEKPGLEAGFQKPYTQCDVDEREAELIEKNWKGFLDTGGLRWREWCCLDEQYLWDRYQNPQAYTNRSCLVLLDQSMIWKTLSDQAYRKVQEELEILARKQGTRSITCLMRGIPEYQLLETLKKRYSTYLKLLSQESPASQQNGPPKILPLSWCLRFKPRMESTPSGFGEIYDWNRDTLSPKWLDGLFKMLQNEWPIAQIEMQNVVAERWEEKGKIALPSSDPLGSWSQEFYTPPGQSQPPFLMGISGGQAPTTQNDAPPTNGRYQSSRLGSIGSGRPSQPALNSFNGSHEYNQFGR
jgi:hypothetical protein